MEFIDCISKVGSDEIDVVILPMQSDFSWSHLSKSNIHVVLYFTDCGFGCWVDVVKVVVESKGTILDTINNEEHMGSHPNSVEAMHFSIILNKCLVAKVRESWGSVWDSPSDNSWTIFNTKRHQGVSPLISFTTDVIVGEARLREFTFLQGGQFLTYVGIVVFVGDTECQVVSTEHIIQVEWLCLL